MGIVLKKSFKGEHFWIPPIPKQIKDSYDSKIEDKIIKEKCIKFDIKNHE